MADKWYDEDIFKPLEVAKPVDNTGSVMSPEYQAKERQAQGGSFLENALAGLKAGIADKAYGTARNVLAGIDKVGGMQRGDGIPGYAARAMWPDVRSMDVSQQLANVQNTVDNRAVANAPLKRTWGGGLGNLATDIAPTLVNPTSIPGAAAMGGFIGAMQPVTSDQAAAQPLLNIGSGAGLGALGQAIGTWAGKGSEGFISKPRNEQVATSADRLGVRLTPGQLTGSQPSLILENKMAKTPGSAAVFQNVRDKNAEAINRAWQDATGAPITGRITEKSVAEASNAINKSFNDVYPHINTDLSQSASFNKALTNAIAKQQNLRNKADQGIVDEIASLHQFAKGGPINGEAYRAIREDLQNAASKAYNADDNMRGKFFNDILKAIDDSVEKSLPPNLVGKLQQARDKSGAYQTAVKGKAISDQNIMPGTVAMNMRNFNPEMFRKGTFPQPMMDIGRLGDVPRVGNEFSGQLNSPSLTGLALSPLTNLAARAYLKQPSQMLNLATMPIQGGRLPGLLGFLQQDREQK